MDQRRLLERAQAVPVPEQAHRRPSQSHHTQIHEQQHGVQRERSGREHQNKQAEQLAGHLLSSTQQSKDHAHEDRPQKRQAQATHHHHH